MDGIHDLGGMHGFGPVPIKEEDVAFKWHCQRRAFALVQALAGPTPYVADMHRQKIEQLPAVDYLRWDYFDKWLYATEELMKDAGLVSEDELREGKMQFSVDLDAHPPSRPEALVDAMKTGQDMRFPPADYPAGFIVGQTVRVRANCPQGHTRVPRYVRGRLGKITKDEGVFQFADTVAAGQGPHPQHCYNVAFSAKALWGENAENPGDYVYLDLAEAYLEHI
ncbi:nitrile hydratase subunit beta [Sneathiella marina]|uniref:Nitrile hydratase subunit beta n=1 Tax=Sneathiella marina TaxID=2950108 RepID=A0ABY4W1A3_9PROT|nr:nitrile hydratase subunit beta [Sneathiella marina]USG60995.1 nitrile hydratase subunit beta [Sneathiella marina]